MYGSVRPRIARATLAAWRPRRSSARRAGPRRSRRRRTRTRSGSWCDRTSRSRSRRPRRGSRRRARCRSREHDVGVGDLARAGSDVDAVVAPALREERADLRAEGLRGRRRRRLDERHVDAERACRRRDLGPDEAAADDRERACPPVRPGAPARRPGSGACARPEGGARRPSPARARRTRTSDPRRARCASAGRRSRCAYRARARSAAPPRTRPGSASPSRVPARNSFESAGRS